LAALDSVRCMSL